MTDPHDLDELASAHLDGATTPEEAQRIAADPALQARVDELRVVREQLRAAAIADPPIAPERRDASIAAALEMADQPLLADITPLAPARSRRRPAIKWVAAGALLVAAAGRILVTVDFDDGDGDVAATALEEAGDGGSSAERDASVADDATEAEAGFGGDSAEPLIESAMPSTTVPAGTALAPASARELGAFPDLNALGDAVRAAIAAPPDGVSDVPVTEEVGRCLTDAGAAATAAGGELVLRAIAVLAEQPVVVTVLREADGVQVLTVADPAAGCSLVHRTVL